MRRGLIAAAIAAVGVSALALVGWPHTMVREKQAYKLHHPYFQNVWGTDLHGLGNAINLHTAQAFNEACQQLEMHPAEVLHEIREMPLSLSTALSQAERAAENLSEEERKRFKPLRIAQVFYQESRGLNYGAAYSLAKNLPAEAYLNNEKYYNLVKGKPYEAEAWLGWKTLLLKEVERKRQ